MNCARIERTRASAWSLTCGKPPSSAMTERKTVIWLASEVGSASSSPARKKAALERGLLGAGDGIWSPRELRSSVSRGSESPPDSHSPPLPFKSRLKQKQPEINSSCPCLRVFGEKDTKSLWVHFSKWVHRSIFTDIKFILSKSKARLLHKLLFCTFFLETL